MGIRYYAYAFDAERTAQALADPAAFISSDPFADAWGMEPHAEYGVATLKQRTSERDLLYLDKAWSSLQVLTGRAPRGSRPRPSYRMFEGWVTPEPDGYGWLPWVRALRPEEMPTIAEDLGRLKRDSVRRRLRRLGFGPDEIDYVLDYMERAQTFVDGLAEDGRGMAYLIG